MDGEGDGELGGLRRALRRRRPGAGRQVRPAHGNLAGDLEGGAPSARCSHTAVWTGSVMVVWGGYGGTAGSFDTGGRYDPAADTWTATSTVGAPSARGGHTAVWTGSVMVVWGGNNLVTGGRYVLIAAAPPVANA